MNAFSKYVNEVTSMEVGIPIWRIRFDGEDLRNRIEKADANRRSAHDNAMYAFDKINRLLDYYDLKPLSNVQKIFDKYEITSFGELMKDNNPLLNTVRIEAAEEIGKVVDEFFLSGIGADHVLDKMVEEKKIFQHESLADIINNIEISEISEEREEDDILH